MRRFRFPFPFSRVLDADPRLSPADENLSDDDEPSLPKAAAVRKAPTARRKSTAALDAEGKPGKPAARRSARKSNLGDETTAMEVEV